MPVNVGPLEWALMQSLPLLCGGSILVALVAIFLRMGRKPPNPPAPPPNPPPTFLPDSRSGHTKDS